MLVMMMMCAFLRWLLIAMPDFHHFYIIRCILDFGIISLDKFRQNDCIIVTEVCCEMLFFFLEYSKNEILNLTQNHFEFVMSIS